MTAKDTLRGRYYQWQGDKYVSVTTAIDGGVPKMALYRWLVKEMARKAVAQRSSLITMSADDALAHLLKDDRPDNDQSNIGTRVHSLAEKLAKGHDVSGTRDHTYLDPLNAFNDKYQPTYLELECALFNRTYGYAGRADAIVEIDGLVYMMDIKTGKRLYPEHALQIAAYRYCEFIGREDGTEDLPPKIDGGIILHVRPPHYEVVPVECGPHVHDAFLAALDMWVWSNIGGQHVIGEPWK